MDNETRKEAALYAQLSTFDESCDANLQQLRRFTGNRFGLFREYLDLGTDGSRRCRLQLDNLIEDARKRLFDVVVVWGLDRFARSPKHLIEILDGFGSWGIDFVSYTEGINTTTPSGHALFHIIGAIAQFDRDSSAARARTGDAFNYRDLK
jgi:DNA invertase Pin-like site-specific DNA recombinase